MNSPRCSTCRARPCARRWPCWSVGPDRGAARPRWWFQLRRHFRPAQKYAACDATSARSVIRSTMASSSRPGDTRLAADRRRTVDLTALHKLLSGMDAALETALTDQSAQHTTEFQTLDTAFHMGIAQCAQNDRLLDAVADARRRMWLPVERFSAGSNPTPTTTTSRSSKRSRTGNPNWPRFAWRNTSTTPATPSRPGSGAERITGFLAARAGSDRRRPPVSARSRTRIPRWRNIVRQKRYRRGCRDGAAECTPPSWRWLPHQGR